MIKDKLIIFDTTMRDGEQSPGASMTGEEKLRIAKSLEKMKVDVIEAGFASASDGDFEAINQIARQINSSRICSLARAMESDIRRSAEAVKPAAASRIHTFIATSPIHMQHKLAMTPEQVLARAVDSVKLARNLCDDIEFSAEDAVRSDFDFLCRIFEAVINAGARTINIPDTVGYTTPQLFGDLVKRLRERLPNSDKAVFSVHCHNDLGMAVANSLSAVLSGARQVECTINGLGERSGNAALEEVVMAVRTRSDVFPVEIGLDARQIVPTSKLVSQVTGFPVQPNKAIVGANAFAHESGIHQDGVIKHRETYEIMLASDVGWTNNSIILGKHSGRNALRTRLAELGVDVSDPDFVNDVFSKFKNLADKKHDIFDEDLQALVENQSDNQLYLFNSLSAESASGSLSKATVELLIDGSPCSHSAEGNGPVDAAFTAIRNMSKSQAKLLLYSVNAITGGTDSQGEVSVRLAENGCIVNGTGTDTDIVVASAKAYVDALNHMARINARESPQKAVFL